MFLHPHPNGTHHQRFPRIRGDVPFGSPLLIDRIEFSPHTRGCSLQICKPVDNGSVFPAYAGMFLNSAKECAARRRFPRIRGDVPVSSRPIGGVVVFSPHTRGCSAKHGTLTKAATVFPAYAGMFPSPPLELFAPRSFPRIRGDVPSSRGARDKNQPFSPHTRGCSWREMSHTSASPVFPAYAGMFR